MARKRNAEENINDASLERCIKTLEDKGTKKTCCQILNISYNVSRLDKLIETYKEKKIKDAERRAEKRGKPATKDEISFLIKEYLEGATIDSIGKSLFRGTTFVNRILDDYAVPKRQVSTNYFKPELIPENAVREKFEIGERVWSARYNSIAIINGELVQNGQNIYRCWLAHESQQQFCYQPWWELGSLQKLRDEGILQ